jgi:hypothetical protein
MSFHKFSFGFNFVFLRHKKIIVLAVQTALMFLQPISKMVAMVATLKFDLPQVLLLLHQ